MKIGTAPWMIDASPESIRVSPQERSQNGQRRVHEPDDDEPAPGAADLGERLARAEAHDGDRGEQQGGRAEAAEDQRRRRELPVGDLDQHERRAPDEREHGEHDDRPTHLLVERNAARLA